MSLNAEQGVKSIDFKNDRRFMGHPKGLLTTTTMAIGDACGRYGMTAILIYYLYETVANGGLGFSQTNAAQFVNVYTSLSFMCGIVGGYIADRFIGVRKAIGIGYTIRTLGYLLLAIPAGGVVMYISSQVALLLAAMTMGTSLYALTGKMYSTDDPRRDSGFSMMYIMNNVGAVAPVITGAIAIAFNYHIGFLFSAVIQGAATVVYFITNKKYFAETGNTPDDPVLGDEKNKLIFKMATIGLITVIGLGICFMTGILDPTSFCNLVSMISIFIPLAYIAIIIKSKKTTSEEARRVKAFIAVFIANCFNMMIFYQSTSILAIYAAERVDLNIFGIQITPASFQTLNAVYAIIFGSLASVLWIKLGKKQPSISSKFGIGTLFWAFGPLFMIIPLTLFPETVKVSPMWLIVFYALITWGEAMTSPVGMSCSTAVAPAAFTTQMVTVFNLTQSTGAGLSSLAVNFYKVGHEAQYFLFIGLITGVVGLLVWLFNKKISNMMGV